MLFDQGNPLLAQRLFYATGRDDARSITSRGGTRCADFGLDTHDPGNQADPESAPFFLASYMPWRRIHRTWGVISDSNR